MFTHIKTELPELRATTFKNKRWYEIPNGDFYPSITSVLSVKEKPYLIEWQKSLGPEKAKKENERTKDRGHAIHAMMEKYLKNDNDPIKGQEKEHIKQFYQLKLVASKINNIRAMEATVYSDFFGIAGRVDCIAEFNGVLSIIDFKTSNGNKTEDMIEDYFLQETFYALAFTEMTGESVEQIVTLMSVERGIAPLIFKKPIVPYILPLKLRADDFYAKYE